MVYRAVAALLIGLMGAIGSAQPVENPQIRAFHDAFFAAWNRADLETLTASLTADTVYHPMNGTTISGRDTLKGIYGQFLADYNVTMAVHAEVLQASGDQGIMMGLYRSTMSPKDGSPRIMRSGRYYMALRKEADGQWRIARELTQPTADDVAATLGLGATTSVSPGSPSSSQP